MRWKSWSSVLVAPIGAVMLLACVSSSGEAQEGAGRPRKVLKSDDQWAKLLTAEQFMVTRRKATEPAFSGKYVSNHARGTYLCVCCGAPLFSSLAKFDSGTGWPSFFQPVDLKKIDTAPDYHQAEPRVEVMCNDCGAHLGHVFSDGPPPTGLRFCINSLALKFSPATGSAATTSKAKSKSKAKTKGKPAPEPEPESTESPAAPEAETAKPADPKTP